MGEEDPSETWHVFCAIELPEPLRERMAQHISTLRSANPEAPATWSRTDNIHLTLKFLGNIQQSQVGRFSQAAAAAVAGSAPFNLGVGRTGVFPQRGSARVLWIGIDDLAGELVKLHARLEDESAKVGFAKEARSFHPHLTLARLRKPRSPAGQPGSGGRAQLARLLASAHKQMRFEPAEITVEELLVVRSELSSEGSKYTVISRHALGASDEL